MAKESLTLTQLTDGIRKLHATTCGDFSKQIEQAFPDILEKKEEWMDITGKIKMEVHDHKSFGYDIHFYNLISGMTEIIAILELRNGTFLLNLVSDNYRIETGDCGCFRILYRK